MEQEIFFVGCRHMLVNLLDDIKMFGIIKQINKFQNFRNNLKYIIPIMILAELIVYVWG
jgi:hypothetical protein